ncbi:REH1 [Candida margitis]|uniref:REH1 n=1 Tax=Candida margitis TaxID=1775924 RepID=UPI002226DBDC|nr:REH1 [Candida margitis]KAI5969581.1 REH1 [Candida margitis]
MSFLPNGSNPATSSFTCNTCGVRFISADLQRQHMKTEWHRYNLKRKVAQLPSISSETFAEKILSSKLRKHDEQDNEDEYGFYVATRKKKNNSRKQSQRGLASIYNQRGRAITPSDTFRLAERSTSPAVSVASELSQFSLGDDHESFVEIEPIYTGSELNFTESAEATTDSDHESEDLISDEDSESEFSEADLVQETSDISCFYCGLNNHDVESNIKHMYKSHGLYIPERSFLVDVNGLLEYLGNAVSRFECLVCGFQGKSLVSIRQHLYSKGHCKLPYETKDEREQVAQYYDFMEEEAKEEKEEGETRDDNQIGNPIEKHVGFDVTECSPGATSNENDVSEQEKTPGINDNYTLVSIDSSGVELTTPIGSRLGHRSMHRYYRQNIPLALTVRDEGRRTQAVVDRRFAPGITWSQVTKQEKQSQRAEQIAKNDEIRKLKPKKANYQKHFRDEILGT